MFHGLTEFITIGSVGKSLWLMNIPMVILCFSLWYYMFYEPIDYAPKMFLIFSGLLICSLFGLVFMGFFSFNRFDYNWLWGLSKIFASIAIMFLF